MNPTRLKKYSLIFSSILLALIPTQLSDACGWNGEDYVPYTAIFDNGFFSPRDSKKFELFSDVLFNFEVNVKDDHEKNTEEWTSFLKGISKDDAYHLVYSSNEQELNAILKNLTSKSYPDETSKALSDADWKNVISYLMFVRKCQPYVNEFDDWSGCFEKGDVFNGLFQQGEEIANNASTDFMKVRIGYQLCRLAHYMGDFGKCKSYYEKYVAPLKPESVIYYWAMAHYAAALKSEGKLADAQFHYAQVYRHCSTKRLSSFRSMYYNEIDSALNKCTESDDKISLYVLNSLENGYGNLANMEAIYQLNPKSPELEVLLYKEIHSYEMSGSMTTDGSDKTVADLLAFTEKGIESGQMFRPYIWQLSAGYLSFLIKSYEKSHEYYNEIKSATGANVTYLKQYVTLLEVVLKAAETKKLNSTFEESLQRYLVAMASVQKGSRLYDASTQISQYVYQLLYTTYREQGEFVKAELVAPHFGINAYEEGPPNSILNHPDSATVEGLIKFIDDPELNTFEKYLVSMLPYKKEQLMELQGTILFRLGHLTEAVSYFDQSGELASIDGDPFETKIQDCIECGENTNSVSYTKKTLAIEMMKYEKLAATEKSKQKVAEYFLLLGNAWYNTTSYGKTWQHLAYDRPWGDLGETTDHFENFFADGKLDTASLVTAYSKEEKVLPGMVGSFPAEAAYYYDCTTALSYYKKAIKLSTDPEFKAKATFMAAKCEENARQVKEPIKGLAIGSHTYYSQLYNQYSNTKFYSEIIQECSYVRNYKEFRDANK